MSNNKTYIILAISVALNLFAIGVFAGKALHRPYFNGPKEDFFKQKMHHFNNKEQRNMMRDGTMGHMMENGNKMHQGFHEKFHKKGFKSVFCNNVSEDVKKIEKDMMDKNRESFKKSMEDDLKLKQALKEEFIKPELNFEKINELFTKQTESFINIQKQAQSSLIEMIKLLPPEKRAEVICFGDKMKQFDKQGSYDKPRKRQHQEHQYQQ